MKTQQVKVLQSFLSALSKVFSLKQKNNNASEKQIDFCQDSSTLESGNSLCLGQTKGYADFLPNQNWQWFTSI